MIWLRRWKRETNRRRIADLAGVLSVQTVRRDDAVWVRGSRSTLSV